MVELGKLLGFTRPAVAG
jgi:hypothetical protein